jgi:hypothetical protein
MGQIYSMHRVNKKCIQNVGWRTSRKEATKVWLKDGYVATHKMRRVGMYGVTENWEGKSCGLFLSTTLTFIWDD